MNPKHRYILKFLILRAFPFLGTVCIMAAALIWAVAVYGTFPELIFVSVVSAVTILCHLAYYSYHIISFSSMIKRQEAQYRTVFNDKGAKTVSIFEFWTICSDNWLISPGKFAIHKREIKSVSLGESYSHRQSILYPVRIKTCSGKTYQLKFSNEIQAKAVRNWGRRSK